MDAYFEMQAPEILSLKAEIFVSIEVSLAAKLHFSAAMDSFQMYLLLGFEHIVSWSATDHLLFLLLLVNGSSFSNIKALLFLVTGFTIGHSITLALAALDIVHADSGLIEFLIPLTIALTAVFNLIVGTNKAATSKLKVALVSCFGLIHGLGFSNYLQVLLSGSESVSYPLLGFNIGVELGQLLVVVIIISTLFVLDKLGWVKSQQTSLFLNGVAMGAAIIIMKGTFLW